MKVRTADFGRELRRCATANQHNGPLWVGLAGAPGSGKSTLAKAFLRKIDGVCVIPMDGYHLRRAELDRMDDPQNAHLRRGAPFTFDADRFFGDLAGARRLGYGSFPEFEHSTGDPVEDRIHFDAGEAKIVLVEGNYLLLEDKPWDRLKQEVFDLTCWLNVPVDECCERVHQRNVSLGITDEQSRQKIERNDRLNAELVSEFGAKVADWVLTGG